MNVLALCGSRPEGVTKAVSVFLKKYMKPKDGNLILPEPIIDVEFEKKDYKFCPPVWPKRMPQYTELDWFQERLKGSGFMDEKGNVITASDKTSPKNKLIGTIARMGDTWFRRGNRELLPIMKEVFQKNRHLLKNPAKGGTMSWRLSGQWRG